MHRSYAYLKHWKKSACGRSSEYAAVKESFDEQYKRQQAVIQPLQPAALIAALERAASNADKDSDQVGTHVPQRVLRHEDVKSSVKVNWERRAALLKQDSAWERLQIPEAQNTRRITHASLSSIKRLSTFQPSDYAVFGRSGQNEGV